MRLVIATDWQLRTALGTIRKEFERTKYLQVTLSESKPRTPAQNKFSHVWYEQIAVELGAGDTPEDVKAECKLRFGVPILRRDDPDYRAMYDGALKGLSYEKKLSIMRYLPVTSLMLAHQKAEYLTAVQIEYAKQGVVLE